MKKHLLYIVLILLSADIYSQVSKSVSVSTSGTLSTFINATEQATVTNLTVSGYIDARDVAFMRDKMKVLSVVNLSTAKINLYIGTAGTYSGVTLVYPANEMPMYSFYNANTQTFKPNITSVTLPATITSIGYLAFYYCWNISGTFTIPASVKSIADYALYGCKGISNYVVETANTRYSSSNGILLNKAQDSVFICPTSKTGTVSIPSTVTWIGSSAFEGCSGLTGTLTLPATLKKIEDYAFYYCSGLSGDLALPSTLNTLGNYAFYGCSGLNGTVTIQKNLTKLGTYSFLLCNNLQNYSVNSMNTQYTSSNGVLYSKIADTLIVYPAGKAGSFTIPSTVKVLKDYSLYNCSGITGTLDIPANIDSIGNYALFGCSQISAYTVNSANSKYTAEDGVIFSTNKSRLIVCPALKTGSYLIPTTVKRIEASAFCNCSGLTGMLSIPANVNYIGDYAFYGCNQIDGFNVDASNQTFSSLSGFLMSKNQDSLFICPQKYAGKYTVPNSVKYIGYSAFDGCTVLTEVVMPSSVTYIDNYAFEYCTGLTRVRIGENISTIGSSAFYNCTALQKLEIKKATPPTVDYYTFNQINKTTCNLVIPVGATAAYMNANYWNEFDLMTESNFDDTAIPESNQTNYKVSVDNQKITVTGFYTGENISVYDVSGKIILKTTTSSELFSFPVQGHSVVFIKAGKALLKAIY